MYAVVIADGDLSYEERPDPVPGDTELLVAVRAAGINAADLVQRRGFYPAPLGSPADIPGLEFAGTVVGLGRSVTKFSVGDNVMAVVGGGGQATMITVDESHALQIPLGMDWVEAGGFPEVFSTAFDALFNQAELRMGERLLITGAAGGVGTAGVQLGAATGAHVVASVRDPNRRDAVAGLGAHEVIGSDDIGDHGPYDVVLELIGAQSLPTAVSSLATDGRAVVIGVGSGANVELNLFELMIKRARLSGSTLRARDRQGKAVVADGVQHHVVPLLDAGSIRVPISATFDLRDAAEAYERFAAGAKLGKIVLVTGG